MKSVLNILILTFSYAAFAGNGGGTMAATDGKVIEGGSVGTMKSLESIRLGGTGGGGVLGRLQIVFNMGQKDGLVKYAHGQLRNGEWIITEYVNSVESVVEDSEFVKALSESQMKQDWAELK